MVILPQPHPLKILAKDDRGIRHDRGCKVARFFKAARSVTLARVIPNFMSRREYRRERRNKDSRSARKEGHAHSSMRISSLIRAAKMSALGGGVSIIVAATSAGIQIAASDGETGRGNSLN